MIEEKYIIEKRNGELVIIGTREKKEIDLTSYGFPLVFKAKTFSDFFPLSENYQQQINIVQSYLLEKSFLKGIGLFISGPANSGKTFLMTLVSGELFKEGLIGKFLSLSQLVNFIGNGWGKAVEELKDFSFICIDDFFPYLKDSSIFISALRDIFEYFENKRKPLFITSRGKISDFFNSPFREVIPILSRFLKEVHLNNIYDPKQILKLREKYL